MRKLIPATVEICFTTGEHWFRCGECGSLNIDDQGQSINNPRQVCPDCHTTNLIPQTMKCDCQSSQSSIIENEMLPKEGEE